MTSIVVRCAILVFTSQGQAKRFFVDKIVKQAVTDGAPLSDAERQMLSFSESDPEFVVSPALVEKLQAQISDGDYETKVAGLLERSWRRDVESDSAAPDVYREAFTVLNQGDHYLLIMIKRALGRHLRPWWAFWR
jgi:anti-sigma28 factor (negative regulator of flagellin synthesis)